MDGEWRMKPRAVFERVSELSKKKLSKSKPKTWVTSGHFRLLAFALLVFYDVTPAHQHVTTPHPKGWSAEAREVWSFKTRVSSAPTCTCDTHAHRDEVKGSVALAPVIELWD
jgi:hypothetical protein